MLGAEFDRALLQRIASEPRSTEAALHRLAAADLIRADGAGGQRWRFTHALLHEVAYQNLLLARRTELHQRAGRALEAELGADAQAPVDGEGRSPRRLAELEALGHHWSLSPDKARGAHYLMAAGDWARAVYANDDAIRHYERALRTLAEAAADTAAAAAEVEAAELDARERLADLLGLHGAAHRGAGALRARASRRSKGGAIRCGPRACCARSAACTGRPASASARAPASTPAWSAWAKTATRSNAPTCSRRWAGSPFAPATTPPPWRWRSARWPRCPPMPPGARARPAVVRAEACNTLGIALARLGRPSEAVAQIESSVAQAEANNLLQAACRGYTNLGVLYASLDPQRSIETCLRGLETAKKVGDLGFQSRLYANLAVAYCALTNRCEAEGIAAAHAAANLDRRLGLLDHLAVPLIVLGQIHQCHGDHARAFASYRGSVATGRAGRRASTALSLLRWFGDAVSRHRAPGRGRGLSREGAGGLRTRRPRARRLDGASVPLLNLPEGAST